MKPPVRPIRTSDLHAAVEEARVERIWDRLKQEVTPPPRAIEPICLFSVLGCSCGELGKAKGTARLNRAESGSATKPAYAQHASERATAPRFGSGTGIDEPPRPAIYGHTFMPS